MTETLTTIVGGGGMLGSAVAAEANRRLGTVDVSRGVPWSDPAAARAALRQVTEQARSILSTRPARWLVVWCAGRGRPSSAAAAMEQETATFAAFVDHVATVANDLDVPTSFVFASSGGAVWSGSSESILTEDTPVDSWHAYGDAKLAQEDRLRMASASSSQLRARLSRLSNVYGGAPDGQPRGLIGHMVLNALARRPTSIYVPLDTERDYVERRHAASVMISDGVSGFDLPPGTISVDLVASGRTETIAKLGADLGRVIGRRVPMSAGPSDQSSTQPQVLAFRSVKRQLPSAGHVPLVEGLHRLVRQQLGAPQ